jgi:hypothetical protein
MRIFKTNWFQKWATGEGLTDESLRTAVREMTQGLIDADLGGRVVKKRVALPGRGKRGGSRTLVAFEHERCAFFIYGFAKNVRANVSQKELKALKRLAQEMLGYSDPALSKALRAAELVEVEIDG